MHESGHLGKNSRDGVSVYRRMDQDAGTPAHSEKKHNRSTNILINLRTRAPPSKSQKLNRLHSPDAKLCTDMYCHDEEHRNLRPDAYASKLRP